MHSVLLTETDFTRVMALQPDPNLRAELERAIVVAPGSMPPDVVTMDSVVRYRDMHAGVSREVQIVYPEDADAARGKISVLAPVGAARDGSLAVVVDLCCGSGAVGAALLAALDGVEVHAADIDPAAVRCARRNVVGPRGHVYAGDLDAPLSSTLRGRVDVLVANAPYVPSDAIRLMPPEARDHEPRVALDGGTDGLDVQRRVIAAAPRWLAPGGHLLIETSRRQAPLTAAAISAIGLVARVVTSEDLDATVVVGARPGQTGVEEK